MKCRQNSIVADFCKQFAINLMLYSISGQFQEPSFNGKVLCQAQVAKLTIKDVLTGSQVLKPCAAIRDGDLSS